jgi:CheY-like chemotaxis protein
VTKSLDNIHVMVVEDTMTQAMMIQHVLEKERMRVTIARSGEKALTALAKKEDKPDLILCDVNMPEMSGYELCTKLKSDAELAKLPFVLLSTLVDNADLLHVIESGADNFIYKTFEDEYFLQRLGCIWSSWNVYDLGDPKATTIFINGERHHIRVSSQRLANLLVSAFETAVFHNRRSGG